MPAAKDSFRVGFSYSGRRMDGLKKNFGQKCLDGAKYIGKNSWKALPFVGLIDLIINESKKNQQKSLLVLKGGYHNLSTIFFGVYLLSGGISGLWTPSQYNQYFESQRKIINNIKYHIKEVDSSYNSLFKDAKNFDDSLAIYNHYCLPIKLEEPTFDEKETAVKINNLEKNLKIK